MPDYSKASRLCELGLPDYKRLICIVVKWIKRDERGDPVNEKIIIEYTPEKNDYIQASKVLAKKTPSFRILAGIILLVAATSIVILFIPSLRYTGWLNVATVTLLVCAFYIFYYLVLIPYQLSRSYQRSDSLKMNRRFTLGDEHVLMEIGENSSILPWEKFQKVMEGKEIYLLVFMDENRIYPLLPKRSFPDEATRDAFLNLIKSKSVPLV
jgi:hypothetical protein